MHAYIFVTLCVCQRERERRQRERCADSTHCTQFAVGLLKTMQGPPSFIVLVGTVNNFLKSTKYWLQ